LLVFHSDFCHYKILINNDLWVFRILEGNFAEKAFIFEMTPMVWNALQNKILNRGEVCIFSQSEVAFF